MTRRTTLALTLCAGALAAAAQEGRTVVIEPTEPDIISTAITEDYAANGAEVVSSTTYLLRRGATYGYNTEFRVQFEDETQVTIAAEEGDGPRPRILAIAPGGDAQAPRAFSSNYSFTLVSLDIESADGNGEQTDNAPIRPRGNATRAEVRDCVLDDQRFEVIRTQGADVRLFAIDNVVSRNYNFTDWYASGGIYFQNGVPQDSIVFRGNTFHTTPARITHAINGATINYIEFTNNTFYDVGGLTQREYFANGLPGAILDLGISLTAVVQNNLFYNTGFIGVDTANADLMGIFNWYPVEQATLDTLVEGGATQSLTITNNNVFTEEALLGGLPADTVQQIPLFTEQLDSFYTTLAADGQTAEEFFFMSNLREELSFENVPDNDALFAQVKADVYETPDTNTIATLRLATIAADSVSFTYDRASMSFTAGTDGGPLGAPRWFAQSATDTSVSTRDLPLDDARLSGLTALPNPAATQTALAFDLAVRARVTVDVFSSTGANVRHLAVGRRPAGANRVDLADLGLPRGTYTVLLTADADGDRFGRTARLVVAR